LPFHELDNVVMSPHRAGGSTGTERLRMIHLARLLNAAARGEPMPNRVDLQAGY
jgi:phosphoglycerate dehydrogenase-like enzyme